MPTDMQMKRICLSDNINKGPLRGLDERYQLGGTLSQLCYNPPQ